MSPRTIRLLAIGLALLLGGGILLIPGILSLAGTAQLQADGVRTTAIVESVELSRGLSNGHPQKYYTPTVVFTDTEGVEHTATLPKSNQQNLYRGSEVRVRYDPQNPDDVTPDNAFAAVGGVLLLALGALPIAGGIAVITVAVVAMRRERGGGRPHPEPAG